MSKYLVALERPIPNGAIVMIHFKVPKLQVKGHGQDHMAKNVSAIEGTWQRENFFAVLPICRMYESDVT